MIEEHALRVPRTARVATLGPRDRPASTWFALHGQGQLAPRFARRFAPLDDGARLVVVPEGLSRFYVDAREGIVGASWMTREARLAEIADYVAYLDHVAGWLSDAARAAPRTVLGFSQGSATAWRWVTQGAARPPERLVIWGGEIPPDLDLPRTAERLAGSAILLVAGTEDTWCPPARLAGYAAQLAEAGLQVTTRSFPGGHDIDQATLAALAV